VSKEALEMLATVPDIIQLKETIKQDPNIAFIDEQNTQILNQLEALHKLQPPVLDLNPNSVQEANKFLTQLQGHRDRITNFNMCIDDYETRIQGYWSLAYNLCMIQSAIESLRSNDQREAYIYQLFPELVTIRRKIGLTKRKLSILSDNVTNAFFTLQQQQKNLMLVMNQLRPGL
jgi:hypothetical protein